MTIAIYDNPEDNVIYFRKLKTVSVDIKVKKIDNVDMDELSMGMTGDYEVTQLKKVQQWSEWEPRDSGKSIRYR